MLDHRKSRNNLDQSPSNRPDSTSKRSQARAQLETRLRDRKSRYNVQNLLPESELAVAASTDLSFRRTSAPSKPNLDRKGPEADTRKSGEPGSRYITLSQAYELIGPIRKKQSLAVSALPDIRIKIIPVSQSCQSIKVTLNHPDLLKRSAKRNGVDRSRSAVIPSSKDVNIPDTSTRRRNATLSRSASGDHKTEAIVSEIDKHQLKADDMILRWLAENPVGAETNPEYDTNSEFGTAVAGDNLANADNIAPRSPGLPSITLDDRRLATLTSTTNNTSSADHKTTYLFNSLKDHSTPKFNSFALPNWPRNAKPAAAKNIQPVLNQSPDLEPRDSTQSRSLDKTQPREGNHRVVQKQKKSVRFGSHDWIIKDNSYLFS